MATDPFTKQLRLKAKALSPVLSVGKQGITKGVVQQLDEEIKRRELIKVRLLRTFLDGKDKKAVAAELASFTKSKIIDQVGNVVVLYRQAK